MPPAFFCHERRSPDRGANSARPVPWAVDADRRRRRHGAAMIATLHIISTTGLLRGLRRRADRSPTVRRLKRAIEAREQRIRFHAEWLQTLRNELARAEAEL
jgi:hypothetical protein